MKYALILAALISSLIANAQGGGCINNEPVAIAIMDVTSPARICQGGKVSLDGAASTPGSGTSIVEYKWDFGDGVLDSLAGPQTSHNYTTGGQYSVQLILTADNGCVSINALDLLVQVSLTPSFVGTTGDQTVCLGDSVDLVAIAEAPVWTPEMDAVFGDGALLPDLQGVPFVSTITVSGFDPGSIIDIVEEAPELCVNMEHSYMGDLVIHVTCPNGQSVITHQQGGGGTWLGVPVDDESDTPGTCWEYCWSADATAGTWADNQGGTLAPGTYSSVEPLTNLIGCPQNGDWTISITDFFAIDNGFLCAWSLGLDTTAALPFTTMLGLSTDSCGWAGAGFIEDPLEPWSGVAVPPNLGDNDYTFSITDNFGCTYDTTVTITVLDMHINAIVGPAALPGPGEVTYSIDPPMPGAQYIVWDPLPLGWLWSGNDVIHTDGVAILSAPPQAGTVQICAQAVFEGCSGDPTCITVSSFVGIEEGTADPGSDLQLAPNPSDGRVLLTRSSAASSIAVELIDPIGKLVFSANMAGTTLSMDVSHLATGTYQVRWSEGDRVRHIPILIAR